MTRGIDAWPMPDPGGIVPGVTLVSGLLYAPAGQVNASPLAPPNTHFRFLGAGGGGNTGPAGSPFHLQGGLACDGRTRYDAGEGFDVYGFGPPPGANEAALTARANPIYWPATGPWRKPGRTDPSMAICGWRAMIRHRAAAAAVGMGHGWYVGTTASGGNPWPGGPLAPEPGANPFSPGSTWPYVAFEAPPGGAACRITQYCNDGVVRYTPIATPIDPTLWHLYDWRVYRSTEARAAKYELRVDEALVFSQSMDAGPGPGDESCSPTQASQTIAPLVYNQRQGGMGVFLYDILVYTGYDTPSTTERGD